MNIGVCITIIIVAICLTIMHKHSTEKDKEVEIAHEKSFWGNDDNNDYQGQIDNLKLKIKKLEERISRLEN